MPFCYGMDGNRRFYSFEQQVGRAAAIVLALQVPPDRLHHLADQVLRRADELAVRDADILILGDQDVVLGPLGRQPGVRAVDCGLHFLARCGAVPGEPTILLTDRSLRIATVLSATVGTMMEDCLSCLDMLPAEAAREVSLPAPVLMLPNLLSRELCTTLIELFESSASIDSGMASIDLDGTPQTRVDHEKKRRRDRQVLPTDALYPELRAMLLRRCAPEIAAAFQARIGHTDRILIARYDDSGGYFHRHRDNVGENVAFREFAISVNLNTEAYEGGALHFPEYNDHAYRPATGAGIIFSASILHEARPVSRGQRYVLLTFFHGEAAESRRRDYEARASARAISSSAA